MRVTLATADQSLHTDQDDGPLLAAFEAAGHRARLVAWDDPEHPWGEEDLVLVRTVWDYHHRRDAFLEWAGRVAGDTTLYNPVEVLRWNTHKSYLMELEERGAPVLPTAWLAAGDRVDLDSLARSRSWSEVVIKPAVGAGGAGVLRLDPHQRTAQAALDALLAAGDALVQPFQPTVATAGELSVVVFDGTASHAVRKRPPPGEFRVQHAHGGRYELLGTVPRDAAQLAEWVVEGTGNDLLYARVDLVEDEVGVWQVAELEATDPSLFLHLDAGAADRLVAAVEARLG